MTSQIKIPLQQLDQQMVDDLQEKYPNAELVLNLNPSRHEAVMSEADFWNLIAWIDWSAETDEAQLQPLIEHLSGLSVAHIYAFDDILSSLLYQLDGKAYAQHTGENAWTVDGHFSVDIFLYARAAVVANGEAFYRQVVTEPTAMPKNIDYESLLYVAMEAFEGKTSKEYTYVPAYPVETFSNKLQWS